MKDNKNIVRYPLDNSAVIHMASYSKGYTNTFRLSITLTKRVCPVTLQKALDNITPRFPTIIAGVSSSAFKYLIEPVSEPPKVQKEKECLAYMPKDMIKKCAVRVLYKDKTISIELFHALTDGYGGKVFLNTLVAEYLLLKYNVECNYSEQIINPTEVPYETELVDDFLVNAKEKPVPNKRMKIYSLPSVFKMEMPVKSLTRRYKTQDLLDAAHRYGTTLTVFLTMVMYVAVLKIQKDKSETKKPVQIMIPINLRKRFKSKTLRNFSLYALPYIEADEVDRPIEYIVKKIASQLKDQMSHKHLRAMIASNVRIQNAFWYKIMPLPIKLLLLRIAFFLYGERNSCLSLSNLGNVEYPKGINRYIKNVEFKLSPRKRSAYNCAVISCNGDSSISFTKKGDNNHLEEYFFEMLDSLMNNLMVLPATV